MINLLLLKNRKGRFTLIELIAVITIMAILMSLAFKIKMSDKSTSQLQTLTNAINKARSQAMIKECYVRMHFAPRDGKLKLINVIYITDNMTTADPLAPTFLGLEIMGDLRLKPLDENLSNLSSNGQFSILIGPGGFIYNFATSNTSAADLVTWKYDVNQLVLDNEYPNVFAGQTQDNGDASDPSIHHYEIYFQSQSEANSILYIQVNPINGKATLKTKAK